MHLRPLPLLLTASLVASSLGAQSITIPAANAAVRGTSQLNTIVRNAGAPRTYMLGINATELTGIPVGATLNGASFRFQVFSSNSPSWPPADITWTDYQIFVGPAIPTATFTGNFMANFVGAPVQVRGGPMILPAGTYTNTNPPAPTPNAWGEFYFDFQVPYVYTGGDLGILFSHPGSTTAATAQYLEVVPSSAPMYGVAFTQSVFPAGVGGIGTTFYVHRLHFGYGAGCAGTGGRIPNLVQNQNTSGGLGGTILMSVTNGPAGGPALFLFGAQRVSVPLPNGCTLLTVPIFTVAVPLDANGRGALPLNVPPGVLGQFAVQAAVIDFGATGSFTVTNGIEPAAN